MNLVHPLIAIIGPTACGKTSLAVSLARRLDADIISGDSRQVYRRMDIGTGKDIDDYTVGGTTVAHHLIDICEPGTKYNVYQFQHDFLKVFRDLSILGKQSILCGGSGLYVESVLRGYRMSYVPEDKALREHLSDKSLEELTEILKSYKTLHNTTDVDTSQRAIRAIEIADYYKAHPEEGMKADKSDLDLSEQSVLEWIGCHQLVFGIDVPRDERRRLISQRLHSRLEAGMVDEVRSLLDSGISADDLIYYGLEYKYLTLYIIGKLEYDEMVSQLEIAIHQFAKRQMTWFRGMERRGIKIHWLDYNASTEEKVEEIILKMKNILVDK